MARTIVSAFILYSVGPLVSATSGGCLVRKYLELKEPADARILSFIKPDEPLDFIVQFKDQDLTYIRDWIQLTNFRMAQAKVRGWTTNKTAHNLPLVFEEGWNKLHLQAVDTRFELTVLLGNGDEATLLDLELDYPIFSVHVEGTFSLCSKGSPEWEVEAEQEVTVPLQPERNQQLQVTGRFNSAAYLLVPSASSDPPKSIITNTTLTIKTRRHRSLITVEVFQGSTENDDQALVSTDVVSPIVLIGVRSGTVHLLLDLSVPATKNNSRSECSAGTNTPFWATGLLCFALLFGGMIFGIALTLLVSWLRSKRKAKKAAIPDAANPPTAHEKEPLKV